MRGLALLSLTTTHSPFASCGGEIQQQAIHPLRNRPRSPGFLNDARPLRLGAGAPALPHCLDATGSRLGVRQDSTIRRVPSVMLRLPWYGRVTSPCDLRDYADRAQATSSAAGCMRDRRTR
jgi:hypothetical protein